MKLMCSIVLSAVLLCCPQMTDGIMQYHSTVTNYQTERTIPEYPLTSLTESEFEAVCLVVAAESRGESMEGQMAVAQVIKNRSELWEMNIIDVITKPYQFAAPHTEFEETTYVAVNRVFRYNMTVFDEPITFFHRSDIKPDWSLEKQVAGQIGNHIFYY